MAGPQDRCWLCNKFGTMTKEHIPPESAYNDCPLVLMKVDERSRQTGALGWTPHTEFRRGLYVRSVCGHCNNRCGRLYGGAYVDLVRRVGERIGDVQEFHKVSILGVRRPLAILKQVVFQFVSANGPGFVRANSWVAPFVKNSRNQAIPLDVGIYLFASNCRGGKTTGISSHIDLSRGGKFNIVAEFSFWPLGTVMSLGDFSHKGLAPIHHWAQYPFDYEATVDLHLPVNPIHSPYPVDFRSESQIVEGRETPAGDVSPPSEEDARRMADETIARSGGDGKGFIFSGHPNTVRKMRQS